MWCTGEECGRDGDACLRSFLILAAAVNAIANNDEGGTHILAESEACRCDGPPLEDVDRRQRLRDSRLTGQRVRSHGR